MSVRALAREMEERYPDLRGASYPGIRHYAETDVMNPRVELLRAIADVLEVRGDWLAFGEGEMTEAEQVRAAGTEQVTREALEDVPEGASSATGPPGPRLRYRAMITGTIRELAGGAASPQTLEDIPYWADGLVEVFKRAMLSDPLGPGEEEEELADVAAAIRGPIEALGVDFERMRERGENVMADYITAVTPALLILVAERGRQQWEMARALRAVGGGSSQG